MSPLFFQLFIGMDMAKANDETKKKEGWNVTEIVELPDAAPSQRVDLDPAKFDRLLKQKNVRIKVYRTMYCPNVKSIDGAEHNIDCDMCMGSGYIDLKPICTDALLQNQLSEQEQMPEGRHDGNSVFMTFPRGIELQYFTLVELLDFTDIFFQRISRSEGNVDRLKYNCKRVNVLLDQDGIEYRQGIDFRLNEIGDIKWSSGKGPAPEVIYSVHYEYPPRFRAVHAMKVNRFSQFKVEGKVQHVKFPEQWMLTKEFLVLRRDKDGNELQPNSIPGYNEETPEE